MFVTEFGIVIEVRLWHFQKVLYSILVTELGMTMEVSSQHWAKASFPMLVTDSGIVTDVRLVQPLKARSPILVTPYSITTFLMSLRYSQALFLMSPVPDMVNVPSSDNVQLISAWHNPKENMLSIMIKKFFFIVVGNKCSRLTP